MGRGTCLINRDVEQIISMVRRGFGNKEIAAFTGRGTTVVSVIRSAYNAISNNDLKSIEHMLKGSKVHCVQTVCEVMRFEIPDTPKDMKTIPTLENDVFNSILDTMQEIAKLLGEIRGMSK